jgi:hypothetical protein
LGGLICLWMASSSWQKGTRTSSHYQHPSFAITKPSRPSCAASRQGIGKIITTLEIAQDANTKCKPWPYAITLLNWTK